MRLDLLPIFWMASCALSAPISVQKTALAIATLANTANGFIPAIKPSATRPRTSRPFVETPWSDALREIRVSGMEEWLDSLYETYGHLGVGAGISKEKWLQGLIEHMEKENDKPLLRFESQDSSSEGNEESEDKRVHF